MSSRQLINPPGTQGVYDRFHFSQAVRVGDTVWVSGQVGIGPNGRPAEGIEAQSRLAFQSLRGVLEAAGASLADVVELVSFHIDLRGEVAGFSKAKDEAFPTNYPAWTAVGVTQLAVDGLLVEIRAVAVVGSAKS